MSPPTSDPFDTAALRAAVLDAWSASPTRLREDANVEQDYALGAYRDRLVVELAQNAADAARAAGVPGRLLLRLDADGLTAANTGAPLDRAGVESLAAMRASHKEAGAVGRFGVGFAAVLAVSDAPEVRSRNGGVRFDREATRVAAGCERQSDAVPALRLPFPIDLPPPPGYDTAVVLPWRDADARRVAEASLREIDDALLLALLHLDDVVVEIGDERHHWQVSRDRAPTVVVEDGTARHWWIRTVGGEPSEEQEQEQPLQVAPLRYGQRQVTIAVPVTAEGVPVPLPDSVARVAHAPTPTDDPLDLPVLVVADLPLDATRRHVVEGEDADEVIAALVVAYGSAVVESARRHGPGAAAALIPGPRTMVGWLDHALRDGIREWLRRHPLVMRAQDARPVPLHEVVALAPADAGLVRALAPHILDLLHPDWYPHLTVLRSLGLEERSLAEIWDIAAALPIPPTDWHAVYDAAETLDATMLEGIPVPLADGRVVRGARGVVQPEGNAETLSLLGAEVVAEEASHGLLARLGARPFDVGTVLDTAFVRRVEDAVTHDEDRARSMVVAAARMLAEAGVGPGVLASLGDVLVPVEGGGWERAASVVLPGSQLDQVVGSDVPRLASDEARATGGWAALGVLAGLVPVTLHEQPLDPDVWDGLVADGGGWCLSVADRVGADDPGELLALEVTVVRGVELLGGASDAFGMLADPDVRGAITTDALILTVDGRRVAVPSPSAWWLHEAPLLEGRFPVEVRLPGDDRLAAFFPVAARPPGADDDLLRALGVHTTLEDWVSTPDGVDELLELLADEDVAVDVDLLVEVCRVLTDVDELPEPPERVRAVVEGRTRVVDAAEVVVAVAPHHALVLRTPHVPGPPRLADVLDLDTSDDARCGASSLAGGTQQTVPALPVHGDWPAVYREHDQLEVGGIEVDWWVADDGEVHAVTLDGLARALAWSGGQWHRRFELAARLAQPAVEGIDRVERFYDA